MSAAKRVRWACPNGCPGVLGPSRPRRDDARRYCLTCTAKTGRLVERVSPALERQRQTAADRSKAKAQRKRERERAAAVKRWTVGEVDLVEAYAKALRLPSLKPAARVTSLERLTLYRRENPEWMSGRTDGTNVHLSVGIGGDPGTAVAVLIHELAHVACRAAGEPWDDKSPAFGRRCLDAFDEWNARHADLVEVDRHGHGAPYRGKHGRAVRARRARAGS